MPTEFGITACDQIDIDECNNEGTVSVLKSKLTSPLVDKLQEIGDVTEIGVVGTALQQAEIREGQLWVRPDTLSDGVVLFRTSRNPQKGRAVVKCNEEKLFHDQ